MGASQVEVAGTGEEALQHGGEVEVRASASIGATAALTAQVNKGHRGAKIYVDASAVSGTSPTLDLKVQTKDPSTGDWIDLPGAVFAQITAAAAQNLTIYPGIAETGNVSVSDVLSRNWRLHGTVGGSDTPTVTFSAGVSYIP